MPGAQPLYIMVKPPAQIAAEIDRRRILLGVDRRYCTRRLHVTVLPLGEGKGVLPAILKALHDAARSSDAAPFPLLFDRLSGSALVGGRGNCGLLLFRKALVRSLLAQGISLPRYDAVPHISLAYGPRPTKPRIAIDPIRWQVEEFLLVRSMHGEARHAELGCWPLTARQLSLVFD